MSVEAPEMPFQKHQEPVSFREINVETAEPKKLFRRLAFVIRPDLVENHEASIKLNKAYEKAQAGDRKELMKMYAEKFPDGLVTPEIDEFEEEQLKRQKIFEIIKSELQKLYKVARKKKDATILRNNELRQRYESLCEENGLKSVSDFRFMDYDSDFINKYLYDRIDSMLAEIKEKMNKSKF